MDLPSLKPKYLNCKSKKKCQIKSSFSTLKEPTILTQIRQNRGMKRPWYIYTMEYSSVVKKDNLMSFTATLMELEAKISQEEKDNSLTYMCDTENQTKGDKKQLKLAS